MSSEGATTQTSLSLQQDLLQTAADDNYNWLQQQSLTTALGRDPGRFELFDGRLRLKAYPNVEIVNKRMGAPCALSTKNQQLGEAAASEAIHRMETALTGADVNVLFGMLNDPPLNLHEIRGPCRPSEGS